MLLLTPLELLERLARLIPPPRIHRHRYHGVLASNARLRVRVVSMGRAEATDDAEPEVRIREERAEEALSARSDPPQHSRSPSRIPWARLLARIYGVLPLLCPGNRAKRGGGGEMRIVSFLTEPATVQHILLHLDLPHRPLPSHPPGDRLREISSWISLRRSTAPSPSRCPESDFNQSVPDDFDG